MALTQQILSQDQGSQANKLGSQGPAPIGNREYMAFFSSAAITFGAMMEMLAAEQQAMNGMAKLAITTTGSRLSAMQSTATSTQATYNADGTSLDNQSYEQWATVGSSLTQIGMGCGGLFKTAKATQFSSKVSSLADDASAVGLDHNLIVGPKPTSSSAGTTLPLQKDTLTPEQLAIVEKTKASLKGAGIHLNDYKKMISGKGLDEDLGQGITLRHVLSFADDNNELSDLRTGLRKGKEDAGKHVESEQQMIQMRVQVGNAIGQAGAATATSQMKLAEAQASRDKGAAALVQTLSQNDLSFAQETQKSQSDQSEKFNNMSGQVWQSINQLVQVDTRG